MAFANFNGNNDFLGDVDWFDSYLDEEGVEYSLMEHLLYGCYLETDEERDVVEEVPYEIDEWLDLWREFIDLDKKNKAVWEFDNKIKDWDKVERIMENLDIIKNEDEELFASIFTSHFVSCLLYEVANLHQIPKSLTERRIKSLAKWIQDHKVEEFSQDDFWRVLKGKKNNRISASCIFFDDLNKEFSRLWRVCCLKKIYISMKDRDLQGAFEVVIPEENDIFSLCYRDNNFENMLNFCDGFVDNEEGTFQYLLNSVFETKDKELLYKCLKKNFFGPGSVKRGIKVAMEKNLYELIPMLMLQAHGEWLCKK